MNKQPQTRKVGKEFLKDLHLLAGFSFPLKCRHCGQVYDDAEQFLETTQATDNLNGIIEGYGMHAERIVEVLRRCECGELLIEEFEDRRARSQEGIEHRAEFGRLVKELRIRGMTRDGAHALLLRVAAGFDSEQLKSIDVH
jgi:hypothetical protein